MIQNFTKRNEKEIKEVKVLREQIKILQSITITLSRIK
jgi:hypothetical protein